MQFLIISLPLLLSTKNTLKYNDTHAYAITANRGETREREGATEQQPELSVGDVLEGMMNQQVLCR